MTANAADFDNLNLIQKYKIDTALFIFYTGDLAEIVDISKLTHFYTFKGASNLNQCYLYDHQFVLATAPLGGPAAAGLMEELGFMGIKNFFACGSAGQIDPAQDATQFVVVERAIRDEGTSYHYLEPALSVATSPDLTDYLANYLQSQHHQFTRAITWTTDAFYRETPDLIALRRQQGAVCVEMECASWAAVAQFRGYHFAQLLYFSDALKQTGWGWHPTRKELHGLVIKLMLDCVAQYKH